MLNLFLRCDDVENKNAWVFMDMNEWINKQMGEKRKVFTGEEFQALYVGDLPSGR